MWGRRPMMRELGGIGGIGGGVDFNPLPLGVTA